MKLIKKIAKKTFLIIFGKINIQNYEANKKPYKGKPLVSFIIPARNEEKSIKKCIEAILNDNYQNKEIIVIDDLSTDKTREIVKKLSKENKKVPIKLYPNKHRLGPGPNRNKGMEKSKGEYIIMFDAHSIIVSDNFVNNYLSYFSDPKVGAVAGSRDWQPKLYQDKVLFYSGGLRPWREMGFQFLDTPNSCFKRSAFEEIGMIDTNLTWGSDFSTTFRMLKYNYKIAIAKEAKIEIDHSITPNRNRDMFRKPFLYGTAVSKVIIPYWKYLVKRKVDLRIVLGGIINLSAIIIAIIINSFWWLPIVTILLFRAHSLAFALIEKTPIKYYIGIPFIITTSEISYAIGFLYGCIMQLFGRKKIIKY